jgi:hypothetical protein
VLVRITRWIAGLFLLFVALRPFVFPTTSHTELTKFFLVLAAIIIVLFFLWAFRSKPGVNFTNVIQLSRSNVSWQAGWRQPTIVGLVFVMAGGIVLVATAYHSAVDAHADWTFALVTAGLLSALGAFFFLLAFRRQMDRRRSGKDGG